MASSILGFLDAGMTCARSAYVTSFNHVSFVFRNGIEVEKVWQDRSRSESWTDEMRETAREYAKKRRRHTPK